MFRQRLLTSLVLIPLVLLAIYYANSGLLFAIVLVFVALSAWEWSQLIPIGHGVARFIFVLLVLSLVSLSIYGIQYWLTVSLMFWGLILFAVLTFPASQPIWGYRSLVMGAGFLLLPSLAATISVLYQQTRGNDLIVYILALVWATDIGAYLAGKRLGRHKLIPMVSPGKTIEGASGGILLAMAVAIAGYFYFKPSSIGLWFALALGTILISMLGDLLISMLKRRCKLKDTGHIFPGHGGVLDRLDSLIAAMPFFYSGLIYFNITGHS